MNLREWNSNSNEFLNGLPVEERVNAVSDELKVFGLKWNKISDVLHMSGVGKTPSSNFVTKRDVLHTVARIFDPLGLITPVTYYGRVFIQTLWKLDISWDDPLPDNLVKD